MSRSEAFARLAHVVERLRAPGGCPWDRRQTHRSLAPYLLEETYEVVDAIAALPGNPHSLREELGDLLLQVLLHAVIAAERGAFGIQDVLETLEQKLIRRHPHVFGDARAATADEVAARWEEIKASESEDAAGARKASRLEGIPRRLPPAARAYELQRRAARAGFDWDDPLPALEKAEEELRELRQSLRAGGAEAVREESGDALFALINVVRLAGAHPDEVLASANAKFRGRFGAMEAQARAGDRGLEDMSLSELDHLWRRAKTGE